MFALHCFWKGGFIILLGFSENPSNTNTPSPPQTSVAFIVAVLHVAACISWEVCHLPLVWTLETLHFSVQREAESGGLEDTSAFSCALAAVFGRISSL